MKGSIVGPTDVMTPTSDDIIAHSKLDSRAKFPPAAKFRVSVRDSRSTFASWCSLDSELGGDAMFLELNVFGNHEVVRNEVDTKIRYAKLYNHDPRVRRIGPKQVEEDLLLHLGENPIGRTE